MYEQELEILQGAIAAVVYQNYDNGYSVLRLACEDGAHFVKTCTGVSAGVATVADVQIMKQNLSGHAVIKAAAGIRTYEDAKALIEAGASRIGTSAGIAIVSTAAQN